MQFATGARSMRNIKKQKRKALRKAQPKIATSSLGTTLGARQRSKKAANQRRGASAPAA